MSFLSPLFLIGAAAAAVPILLHLLKRQPEVHVKFSAVHLLTDAPVETKERRRLRELLLLALRVSALVLLAVAFARPFLADRVDAFGGRVTIVAVDTSLSMAAPGQFEKARRLATAAIEEAGIGDQTAVVLFDTSAQIASALSVDRAPARQAIDAAKPGAGSARYRTALRAAVDQARGRSGRIVVVTDLQASGWAAADRLELPASLEVVVKDVGPAPPNLAVTSARIAGDRIVATVRSTHAIARDAAVRLLVNTSGATGETKTATETSASIGPMQAAEVSVPLARGRWAAIEVADPDGIAADNRRYLVLDTAERPSVLIVTAAGDLPRDAFFVEQALIADGGDGRTYEATGVAGAALASWDQAKLDAHTAVVVLSTRGLEHHGRQLLASYARAGGGVFVAAGADLDGEAVAELLGGARVTIVPPDPAAARATAPRTLAPSDVRHPVLQPFSGRSSLTLVRFDRISTVRAPDCESLARFTTGEPALVECRVGEGRALILASDLGKAWNDFPLHATFVPFLHQAMNYVSRTRQASDYLVSDVPPGVPASPAVVSYAAATGTPPRLVAVNVDPAEADSARLTPDQFSSVITSAPAPAAEDAPNGIREQEDRQHLWQYLLLLMLAALAAESVVAARTA